jgi:transposase
LTCGLTVSELARRYRVGEDRVRGWIRRGEMSAINTADAQCGKPRYVVLPEALELFERGRQAATPDKPAPRRKRRPAGLIDFFPD